MGKKKHADKRTRDIAEVMEQLADSLISHLPHTHGKLSKCKGRKRETKRFHKRCAREYAQAIERLSRHL